MRVMNERKKKLDASIEDYKSKYLNRRNNIIFAFKYIVPYIHRFFKLPVVHANYLFIICKKTYQEIKIFSEAVFKKENIFKLP